MRDTVTLTKKVNKMATQTNCDKCKINCEQRVIMVNVRTLHKDSMGRFVGEDEFNAIELCFKCGMALATTYGLEINHNMDMPPLQVNHDIQPVLVMRPENADRSMIDPYR
jgi:hypothetical protein